MSMLALQLLDSHPMPVSSGFFLFFSCLSFLLVDVLCDFSAATSWGLSASDLASCTVAPSLCRGWCLLLETVRFFICGFFSFTFHFFIADGHSSCGVCSEAQINTQRYGSRPYGVGLLVAGHDVSREISQTMKKSKRMLADHSFFFQGTGSHLYEFSPSGNCYDYIAISIGARAQSAKTYLEKNYESFDACEKILYFPSSSPLMEGWSNGFADPGSEHFRLIYYFWVFFFFFLAH